VSKTIGSEGDTVTDRMDHEPAVRFEHGRDGLYCVKANGNRYVFIWGSGGKQTRDLAKGWVDYWHGMAEAMQHFLDGET
jgi:hypothetical protein